MIDLFKCAKPVMIFSTVLLAACGSDDDSSAGGGSKIQPPVQESEFAKPPSAELFALDQVKAVSKLSEIIRNEYSNHPKSSSGAPSGSSSTDPASTTTPANFDSSECFSVKSAATADDLEFSLSVEFAKCLAAAAKASAGTSATPSPTTAPVAIPQLELVVVTYSKIKCTGQGEAMKSALDSSLKDPGRVSNSGISIDFEPICNAETFELLQQLKVKGTFSVPIDSIKYWRIAPGVGCKYSSTNKVRKLVGTCEYVSIDMERSGLDANATSGKVYSKVVATDVQETADAWPSSGSLAVEINEYKATVTFKPDADPEYSITEPAEAAATGTISER